MFGDTKPAMSIIRLGFMSWMNV